MTAAKRLLGLDKDGSGIFAPKRAHSLLLAAAGSGKTTCGVLPWLLSTVARPSHAIIVNDPKSGEIAAQCMEAFARIGRKVALIDDAHVLGAGNPFRVSLNPFGNIVEACRNAPDELIFATENANHVIIPEPPEGDAKNQYWRDFPRALIEFAILLLLKRNIVLGTPGGVWSVLSDPEMLVQMARIESEEAEGQLAALARDVVDLADNNPEHFAQHRAAAVKALRIYAEGSRLYEAGIGGDLTHADLIREKYVIFLTGNQKHIHRMGCHYGLHLQCFLDALYAGAGPVDFILDECTNTPLKSLVGAITTMRGYGGACHFVAQSMSEMRRSFGQKETDTILENALVKQYFGFSSFEEAEKISGAIGEDQVLQAGIGLSGKDLFVSTNYSSGKEAIFSRNALMRMPKDRQLLHVKDLGWVDCRKIAQHQIAPWCHGKLAANPLEGRQLRADPKIKIRL